MLCTLYIYQSDTNLIITLIINATNLSIYHVICSVTSKINIKNSENLIFVQLAVSHMTLLVNSTATKWLFHGTQ